MTDPADSLCARHREFVPLIAAVEKVEESPQEGEALRTEALTLHEAFAHGLIPHAVGEGRTVFPVLRRITGSSREAADMTSEHREIARLTDELEQITDELEGADPGNLKERALRSALHDLRAAVEAALREGGGALLPDPQQRAGPGRGTCPLRGHGARGGGPSKRVRVAATSRTR